LEVGRTAVNQFQDRIGECGVIAANGSVALTLGFIFFYTWQTANGNAFQAIATPWNASNARGLLERSFAVCRDAVLSGEYDEQILPALLNHCVYVGTMVNSEDDELARMVSRLSALTGGANWSYRFDDSLGYYYFVQAQLEFTRWHDGRSIEKLEHVMHLMEVSRVWYEQMNESVLDREVHLHRTMREQLAREVRSASEQFM